LRCLSLTFDVCAVYRRYRILNSVFRGRITTDSKYLARALKIIIHSNYLYTRDHPQRYHNPMQLELAEVGDLHDAAPADPELGSGYRYSDFEVGDKVQVWYYGSWWTCKVTYMSAANQTLTVRPVGARDAISSVLPRHTKPAPAQEN
jgi:hypothetical protein